MKTLSQCGESHLIQHFKQHFLKRNPAACVGIGDDCAVIDRGAFYEVCTKDLLIEGTHFQKGWGSARDLGYKALSVNVSDVAAMGGAAQFAFLGLALPSHTPLQWVEELVEGMEEGAREMGVSLLGGDTVRASKEVALSITLMGEVSKENLKLRSSAQEGDVVVTTGPLGLSRLALLLYQENHRPLCEELCQFLHRPSPPRLEGLFLGAEPGVHAMMDLSDGLARDGAVLAESSGVELHIEWDALPQSALLLSEAHRFGKNPQELALLGGEDYVLLATVDPKIFPSLATRFEETFGAPLFPIGQVKGGEKGLRFFQAGKELSPSFHGFEHFSPSSRSV